MRAQLRGKDQTFLYKSQAYTKPQLKSGIILEPCWLLPTSLKILLVTHAWSFRVNNAFPAKCRSCWQRSGTMKLNSCLSAKVCCIVSTWADWGDAHTVNAEEQSRADTARKWTNLTCSYRIKRMVTSLFVWQVNTEGVLIYVGWNAVVINILPFDLFTRLRWSDEHKQIKRTPPLWPGESTVWAQQSIVLTWASVELLRQEKPDKSQCGHLSKPYIRRR